VRLPRVLGHRGAAAAAPENTLEGFRRAAAEGAAGVEFDAKLTADGRVVLFHDDTLDRTTDGHGPVAQMSFDALRRLDAGAWLGPQWKGVRIPTLEESLHLLFELGLEANIEIKPCPGREAETARAVVDVVRQVWPDDRGPPLLSSFARESLTAARAAAPDLPRGLLLWEQPPDWAQAAQALGCRTVNCAQQYLTAPWAAAIKRAGYGLIVYTVNDPVQARQILGWGADSIITDRPGEMAAALA
jgi:glycerophosphoryl diester phosphodiesterase